MNIKKKKKIYKLNLNKFTINVLAPIILLIIIIIISHALPKAIMHEINRQEELYKIELIKDKEV